jgi:pimeloyl-ACP methyl ester carboxylesterase
MSSDRIHRALSDDGTQIVGRVHGDGPPLVLVPGGPGDGEFSFRFLVPFLAENFTCYCLSTRGKGLSADHPDHTQERLVADVRAFVDSIGEPVALLGHSSGAVVTLEAAERNEAVATLTVYEPAAFNRVTDEHAAWFAEAVAGMHQAVEAGRWVDSSRIFFERLALANDEELAALAAGGVFDLVAPNLGSLLQEVDQSGAPRLRDPSLPERLTLPVLILQGTRTHPVYEDIVSDLAGRLPDARVVHVDGAGHLGPQLAAEAVAEEISRFAAMTPARA